MENFKPIQNLENSMMNFYVSITQLKKPLTHGQFCFISSPSTLPSLGYIQIPNIILYRLDSELKLLQCYSFIRRVKYKFSLQIYVYYVCFVKQCHYKSNLKSYRHPEDFKILNISIQDSSSFLKAQNVQICGKQNIALYSIAYVSYFGGFLREQNNL